MVNFHIPTYMNKTKHKYLLILTSKHKIMRFHKFAPRKVTVALLQEKAQIIPTGDCCSGESNNLHEQVVCSIASYKDVRTSRPLLEGKRRRRKSRRLGVHTDRVFPTRSVRGHLECPYIVAAEYFNMAYFTMRVQ